ncbi:hypothetical protein [Empedobacter brevis]|uniref:hypothetical protein n=1 Tax=Empedobacter brevis TaxID=247 RepID=UPI0039B09DA2
MNNKQDIKGDNNVQVGVNNGQIIQTKKVKQVTEVLHDASNHITDAQALQIRLKITDIAEMVATNKGNIGSQIKKEYNALYKEFGCTSYKLLPAERFEEAMLWLSKRTGYRGKKNLRHGDPEEWRKNQYKAINARIRQLGMSKEDLLIFAEEKLALKKPLASIKDLSATRLQSLYTYIFSKKL